MKSLRVNLAFFIAQRERSASVLPGMAAAADTPAAMLRASPVRGYAAGMLQTAPDAKVKLSLPPHVAEMLTGWAVFELQKTAEEVLEALAEELVGNEQLRAFAAGLVTD